MNTSIFSKISLDIMGVILLVFLAYLISRNTVLTKRNTKNFMIIIFLTVIVIFSEIGTVIFDVSNASFWGSNIIANIIGFSLSPIITLRIAFLYDENLDKKKRLIYIPLVINVILCIFSSYTGWIFEVTKGNQYSRGPLFFMYILFSFYAFVVLVIANHKAASNYIKGDKNYLYCLYVLVLVGNCIQIIFPNILIIWGCVSVTIVLYYIFLRELQFKFDPLTNLLNRQAFERAMEELTDIDEATILVFDLNNLKNVNDTYGHNVGDTYIMQAAKIIGEIFNEIGKCYRIGGDEFCVLSRTTDNMKIQTLIEKMLIKIDENDTISKNDFYIAYGYAFYDKKIMENIYATFVEADKKMYLHKELSKSPTT